MKSPRRPARQAVCSDGEKMSEDGTDSELGATITSPLTGTSPCPAPCPAPCPNLMLREEDCDWSDEDLTCNVCDRAFPTPLHLEQHMVKKRHWLCNCCEAGLGSLHSRP